MPSGCKDIGIGKLEFVAKTLFLTFSFSGSHFYKKATTETLSNFRGKNTFFIIFTYTKGTVVNWICSALNGGSPEKKFDFPKKREVSDQNKKKDVMNKEFRSPIFCNNEPVTVTFIYIYNRYNNTNTFTAN